MNATDWKVIAEFVGITAIVASLLFVGLQLKQSQEIAVSAQYQDRAGKVVDISMGQIQSETGLRVLGEELKAVIQTREFPAEIQALLDSQSPEELAWRLHTFSAFMAGLDNNYFQYQAGFLDEETWTSIRHRMILTLADPMNRLIYEDRKEIFRKQFQLVADEVISELEAASE